MPIYRSILHLWVTIFLQGTVSSPLHSSSDLTTPSPRKDAGGSKSHVHARFGNEVRLLLMGGYPNQ